MVEQERGLSKEIYKVAKIAGIVGGVIFLINGFAGGAIAGGVIAAVAHRLEKNSGD